MLYTSSSMYTAAVGTFRVHLPMLLRETAVHDQMHTIGRAVVLRHHGSASVRQTYQRYRTALRDESGDTAIQRE